VEKLVQQITKPLSLGVDLGGTKANIVLVDSTGQILFSHKSLIHISKEPKKVIDEILAGADECLNKTGQDAEAFGVGVAAQVDPEGFIFGSPNLGWKNFSLKKELEKRIDLPVLVTNDVRAATWAEWRYGSGKGIDDLAVVFVGTGIGGGVITGGKVLSGCNNSGGELGHMTIVYNGRKCRCPNKGCLEAYAGGWALAERAQEAAQPIRKRGQALMSLAGRIESITAATVAQAFHEGDLLSRLLVEETGGYLAAGVVSVVNAFNPCLVILGGGVIDGIPELVPIVNDIVPTLALGAAVKNLKIEKASLGHNAGAIGAAALAQKMIHNT